MQVALVVGWLGELDLAPGAVEDDVLGPVMAELLARYGHEVGRRLCGDFVGAFEASVLIRNDAEMRPPRGDS